MKKIQGNLLHTITHRMSERVNRDKYDFELSQKETTAILFLMINNIDKSPAVEENKGNYAVFGNGIKTVIGSDRQGRFVVTGYNFEGTKEEAMDSISTVIAQYGYTQEFLDIYAQVGAIASLQGILPQNENNLNSFDEDLCGPEEMATIKTQLNESFENQTELDPKEIMAKVSKETLSSRIIPKENAERIIRSLESGNSPLLPGSDGRLKVQPVYDSSTGRVLPAQRLVPVMLWKQEMGFESNIAVTKATLRDCHTQKTAGERGVSYIFVNKDKNAYTQATYVFLEQVEKPEAVRNHVENKIQTEQFLSGKTWEVQKKEDYLPALIASCRTGLEVHASPEIAEEFKKDMLRICRNQVKEPESRDKDIPLLSVSLIDAEKRAASLVNLACKIYHVEPKSVIQDKKQFQEQDHHRQRKQSQGYDR